MKYAYRKTEDSKIILGAGDDSLLSADTWVELTKEEHEKFTLARTEDKELFIDEDSKLQIKEND